MKTKADRPQRLMGTSRLEFIRVEEIEMFSGGEFSIGQTIDQQIAEADHHGDVLRKVCFIFALED